MAQIPRPPKQGNVTTYVAKVAAGFGRILAGEVDADFDTIFGAWNAGADTVNIRDGAVTSAKLAADAVGPRELQDGGIVTANLGDGSVTTSKIADGAVTDPKIVSLAWAKVTGAPAMPTTLPPSGAAFGDLSGTYPAPTIRDGAVTAAKLAPGAVGPAQIAVNSVSSAQIVDASVGTAELASGAVTTIKIVDGAVTAAKLAAGASLRNTAPATVLTGLGYTGAAESAAIVTLGPIAFSGGVCLFLLEWSAGINWGVSSGMTIRLRRDGALAKATTYYGSNGYVVGGPNIQTFPPLMFTDYLNPGAHTYTVTFQGIDMGGGTPTLQVTGGTFAFIEYA